MSVGSQANSVTVNEQITAYATQLRNVMQGITNLSTWINGQGNGLAVLEALGYNATDAQTAQNMISYLNTIAEVYFGTATQATEFSFNNELSQIWAGQ